MIKLEIDSDDLTKALNKLSKRSSDLTSVMEDISILMQYSVEENFAEEGRPEKWSDLAEITMSQRAKQGKWPGKILQVSQAGLAASISTVSDSESAAIGSNKDYAAIHQFGGMAGRNKKVKIPARPYIEFPEEDLEEIIETIYDYLRS